VFTFLRGCVTQILIRLWSFLIKVEDDFRDCDVSKLLVFCGSRRRKELVLSDFRLPEENRKLLTLFAANLTDKPVALEKGEVLGSVR
jgi:hypothetical protein